MLVTLYHFLFLVSNHLYSLINSYFLPESFRIFLSLVVFVNVFISVIRFDCIYDEIHFKGSVLKIFYYLFDNFNHKLIEQNLRKLSIFTRILLICVNNYSARMGSVFGLTMYCSLDWISGGKLFWIIQAIIMIPIYVLGTFTITSLASLVFIFHAYYKLIFHQIIQQIKSLIPNGKIRLINNRREKKLIDLLNDHNQAAIEIHKMNLIMRRTAATMFITFSLLKIISIILLFPLFHYFHYFIILNFVN